jgi:hypothetical protein
MLTFQMGCLLKPSYARPSKKYARFLKEYARIYEAYARNYKVYARLKKWLARFIPAYARLSTLMLHSRHTCPPANQSQMANQAHIPHTTQVHGATTHKIDGFTVYNHTSIIHPTHQTRQIPTKPGTPHTKKEANTHKARTASKSPLILRFSLSSFCRKNT